MKFGEGAVGFHELLRGVGARRGRGRALAVAAASLATWGLD